MSWSIIEQIVEHQTTCIISMLLLYQIQQLVKARPTMCCILLVINNYFSHNGIATDACTNNIEYMKYSMA